MESKYEKQSINRFIFLKDEQLTSMKDNNIETLGQLAKQTESSLKSIGFKNQEIDMIDFELQRLGMKLRS